MTVGQCRGYLEAAGKVERGQMQRTALAARVGCWAEAEAFEEFMA